MATVMQMEAEPRLPKVRMGRIRGPGGAAVLMAGDLATMLSTGIEVACCGNVHLNNFGLYTSAERKLSFAINDYDEIHPGPWEWDVKRLAASAAVMAGWLGGDEGAADT